MTLYLTDRNTFSDVVGAAFLANFFRINIENVKSAERTPVTAKNGGFTRASHTEALEKTFLRAGKKR